MENNKKKLRYTIATLGIGTSLIMCPTIYAQANERPIVDEEKHVEESESLKKIKTSLDKIEAGDNNKVEGRIIFWDLKGLSDEEIALLVENPKYKEIIESIENGEFYQDENEENQENQENQKSASYKNIINILERMKALDKTDENKVKKEIIRIELLNLSEEEIEEIKKSQPFYEKVINEISDLVEIDENQEKARDYEERVLACIDGELPNLEKEYALLKEYNDILDKDVKNKVSQYLIEELEESIYIKEGVNFEDTHDDG